MTEPEAGPDEPTQGAPESVGDHGRLAKRLNRGGAAVLILEALVVLFVPRAIAQSETGLTALRLSAVLAVVVILLVVAGLQRRSWGPQAGLAVQLPVLATGFFTSVMWFLGGIFALLWWYYLHVRGELLGTLSANTPGADR